LFYFNILVTASADPPVCKLENFGQILKIKREKQKEQKTNQKARSLKEMFFSGGIDAHDLGVKLAKVKEFLIEGHPVSYNEQLIHY
jgi:translation initiation factor IF-3